MTHKPEKLDAKEAAKHMLKAKQILILSGADLSLESGIPSYDSDELWKRNGQKGPRPREYVTLSNFKTQPSEIWDRYFNLISIAKNC